MHSTAAQAKCTGSTADSRRRRIRASGIKQCFWGPFPWERVIEKRNEIEVFFFFAYEPPRPAIGTPAAPLPPRNPKLPPQQQQPSRSQPRPRPRPPSPRSSRAPALLLESISKRDAAPSSTPRAAGITGCALRKAPETFPHTYIEAPRRAAWMSAREPAARCSCGTRSSRPRDNKESRVSRGRS